MHSKFEIHPDISKSETLPAEFYRSDEVFEQIKEKVFLKCWQLVGDEDLLPFEKYAYPFWYMEHYLDEPLVLVKQEGGEVVCLSNVCTHRGNLIVQQAGKQRTLNCLYHGRRFGLKGNFEHMPEFEDAKDFPRSCEGLKRFSIERWGQFIFTALDPAFDFKQVLNKMDERVGFLPLEQFQIEKSLSRDYLVNANWVLYCDNYLEGFHIPFVHPDLNANLDYSKYTTELYDYMSLQIGFADDGIECFALPEGHPDFGKQVAAYYYWVFPNMMFNFYPWGLSINIVKPISNKKTKVKFISYVWNPEKLEVGAGGLLDKVEREDEFVVEGVQKGISSRFYQKGRFSPTREKGVHHFQKLLVDFLNA
ncbi:MAG: aromatic ring-hydroxylating dioxygenase subunit alpha [Crocinitomicaceae bacterium]